MNIKRITRLLRLLQLLQSGAGANAKGLAAECGVNRRTVFRDLEALRQAGVPLEFDKDQQRYSISGAFFLPPTNFTAAETLSLVAMATEMGQSDRLPFLEAAKSAALKLEDSLPLPLRQQLRVLRRVIHVRPGKLSRLDGKHNIYQQFIDAHASRRAVAISYDNFSDGEVIRTKLCPYQMLFNQRSWYVIGHSSLHREVRTFNLSRVLSLEMLGDRFTTPPAFRLKRYLGNAWDIIPEPGRDKRVLVRFKPMVAQEVAEVIWHKTQETRFLDDGSLEFSVRVTGLNEISSWILGYGDQAEVLRPRRLRNMVAGQAQNMAAMYKRKECAGC